MQDRPTSTELLNAVSSFLAGEVKDAMPEERRFIALVAANVCRIVAREMEMGVELAAEDRELFRSLLVDGKGRSDREFAVELAQRIRAGAFDADLTSLGLRLEEHVRRKLAIARPGYDQEG